MTKAQIASMIDHTLLKATATPEQIAALCDTAKALHTASVCVNPCHVALAARLLKDSGVTSVLIGASRPQQIVENAAIVNAAPFTQQELDEIERIAAVQ